MARKPVQPTPPAPPTSGKFEFVGAPARWCITDDVLIVERLVLGPKGAGDSFTETFGVHVDAIAAALRAARKD